MHREKKHILFFLSLDKVMNRPAEDIATGTPDAYDNSMNTLLDDGYLDSSLEESPMQDRT